MVEANLRIVQGLKAFLHDVTTHVVNRAFFTEKPSDFSRERQLPLPVLVGLLLNFCKRSLAVEIDEFFQVVQQSEEAPTSSAFCQQRAKLKPVFFQVWNGLLCESFRQHYGEAVRRWRGFRLIAGDGSTLFLPQVKALREHFGTQNNRSGQTPMARTLLLYDVLNKLNLWATVFPYHQAEPTLLCENLRQVPDHSILLLDRGFPSFALLYLLRREAARGVHFVIRCKLDFNKEVQRFVASTAPSKIVELAPSYKSKVRLRQMGIELAAAERLGVRVVKFQVADTTEVLFTDLLDARRYTLADLKQLYGWRWPVEGSYEKQKNKWQLEQFSGLSVRAIEQDFHASVFTANLQALVEKQCSEYVDGLAATRKHAYQINSNVAVAALKHNVVRLFLSEDPRAILFRLQHAFQRHVVPVRPGRKYKRKRKAKRLNGKYLTLTNYKRAI